MAQARLAERDQRRVDRLVRAAFGPERDPARRRDEQEARILVAGVVEAIEAAGDERVVERADRETAARRTGRPTSPAAASIRNRLLSAMPELDMLAIVVPPHFCADAIFALAKTSGISLRRNRPRWLTQAPRLVETVTSGEVVTMRSARSPPALDRSSRMRPNAAWVDCSSPAGAGSCGDGDACRKLRARFSRAMRVRSISASTPGRALSPTPSSGSHSWPSRDAHRLAQRGQLGRVHQARRDCPCVRQRAGRSP